MNKRIVYIIISIILITLVILLVGFNKKEVGTRVNRSPNGDNNNFDFKIIGDINTKFKENNMISPVSIAYALNMLKDGATDNTRKEIEDVLDNYELPEIINIKNRVNLANLLFVNNRNKNDINKEYIKLLQTEYDSDLIFDDLQTPDTINKWISDKTYGMIKDAIKVMNPATVLGLANTIAVDLEWKDTFDCYNVKEKEFTLSNNEKITTPMMSESNDVAYIESNNAKGIIKDYASYNIKTGEKTNESNDDVLSLEYIAILPNGNIDDYLSKFNQEELNKLLMSKKYSDDKLDINYSLPKYTFDFDYTKFKQSLIDLGIKDAFDGEKSSFKYMVNENSNIKVYVDEAIHKSHIELSEHGTKAAAVTVFLLKDNAMEYEETKKEINIIFDKPFIFIIKEKQSDNIWFYGTVYKPMEFKDNTKCETINE